MLSRASGSIFKTEKTSTVTPHLEHKNTLGQLMDCPVASDKIDSGCRILGNVGKANKVFNRKMVLILRNLNGKILLYLHVYMLFAVKLGEYQAASDSFERSLEMARRQHDVQAEQAIQKALEEVNDKIVRGEHVDADKDEDETGSY